MRAQTMALMLGLGLCAPIESRALDAFALEGGSGDDGIGRGGMAFQWDWGVRWLPVGDWYLGGYFEISGSYWKGGEGDSGNKSLGEIGLTPVFRFQTASAIYGVLPYLEAGIGIHGMTRNELEDKDFGTEFTFGDHGGIGIRFGDQGRFELGYRYQHLSNAGIEEPNDGINFHLVRLGYHF